VNDLPRRLWIRARRRAGRTGLLAAAFLVAAAAIAAWIPGLMQHDAQLRMAIAQQMASPSRPLPAIVRHVPVGEQIGEFVAAFPPATRATNDLDVVFESARQRNVTLLKGDYQFRQEPNAPLVTYTATFPLRSEYGAVKAFATDVLSSVPNASMDELRLSRTDAGSKVLDAVVRFTFVYQRP
jgi:hypothetical protein